MSGDDIHVSTSPDTQSDSVQSGRHYHMVFIGDLGGSPGNGPVSLDKDSFSSVLQTVSPSVPLALTNPLSGSGEWAVMSK